jgi:hypothetical protein
VIWCWGRVARVILPERDAGRIDPAKLSGMLGHELAHWRRRDHVWALVGELLVCALPWHPLAWPARRLLGHLSEVACDAWAISAGASRTEFASALLELLPSGKRVLALGAVSTRRGLRGRIERILDRPHADPRCGRRWTVSAVMALALVATTAALAHRRTTVAADPGAVATPGIVFTELLDDADAPAVRATPAELDLGVGPAAQPKTGTVWVVNTSDQPRVLRAVKASCGCTTVAGFAPGSLAPGAGLPLEITMVGPDKPGQEKTKTVTIDVEGQAPLRIPIHLEATAP